MPAHQPMSLQLVTERLTMRPWDDTDVDDYRALVGERDQRARSAERGDLAPTVENIRERIAAQRAVTERTGLALLAVRRRVESDFIGYCGLIVGRASVDEPEIAYELLRWVHGRGYATEAARAVLDAAIETGRSRLWSTVRAWNAPSFRVLDKLGFRRDHVSTDDSRGELVWLTRELP
ncbi:MAG: GNAT family N-acetyltransferase [Sciscionella sp.]